jgi:Lon protease-like protein
MISDALSTPHRLIGMIQTNSSTTQDEMSPMLYSVGCAGRISSFEETLDGRYLISLDGMIRFKVTAEAEGRSDYRQCHVDYRRYSDDLHVSEKSFDRSRLIVVLKRYFSMKGFSADWESIEACADEKLITTLSMICPLPVAEKQMLLESLDVPSRGEMLTTMLEMEIQMQSSNNKQQGHVRH